ncbi:outer membrane beta-barrel family protein [Flavobacterium caeni]|uniref:Outer membrane receptor proteins, mostly Fe transport n=1 Tax=Flavobacterium caeni TaxID=490189 RepID=A0A1G5JP45_9FLAO|nr:outer membrane beta-barrel family protein [Flavobacterium caeni]SCY90165.1 Outer membrane receptor proteins, mostly Fe transport [Flavobacterium caeni]
MKNASLFAFLLILSSFTTWAQDKAQTSKIKITGKVIEKTSKQPLEYATVTLTNTQNPKGIAGGITDNKGQFDVDVAPGTYNIKIEFISFKATEINNKSITQDTNLGTVALAEDATQLEDVVIRAEATTVQIKLDKKVYSVGQDLMVKGGTVSDVLDNIPSVTVDADGTVALRGNENVRILIDGRPSNAINISEALRLIPADAIEKVEVVTNPSARYDSEGGGGLLNIILKKGKNQGVNGTVIASAGNPENYGLSGNINYKTEQFNLFTTTGYNYRVNPGNSLTETQYLNPSDPNRTYIDERRNNERMSKGINSNFGLDWYLTPSITWSNSINLRKSTGQNPDFVSFDYYDQNRVHQFTDFRLNDQQDRDNNVEYATNFVKNFKKDGHKLTIDASFSKNKDNDFSVINGIEEVTFNKQTQGRNIVQLDYVLPIGEKSQFEAGYKGDFNKLVTDFEVDTLNVATGNYEVHYGFTNELEYKEQINAFYTQFGSKIKNFSWLLGLRYEDSNIDINQWSTGDYNNKKYGNFFPSAFLTYELSEQSSTSLSYSRRISRPRGRMINPFSNYSSNINIFRGNPDLDPSLTDALDLGYLKRWGNKLTLSTSAYVNITDDATQFIRRDSGLRSNGIPVIESTPVNIATETRFGFEFTLNYSPFKWWRLNGNFNFFSNQTDGEYTFIQPATDLAPSSVEVIDLDNKATSWFTRVTSKVTLPYKIDWQTNFTYNGAQKTAQGESKGIASANLGFSKDLFKEKATLALNVQDLFNSRKRINETFLEDVSNSYSEMQWRERTITLSFTYRFNKKKNEKERPQRRSEDDGGEFPG